MRFILAHRQAREGAIRAIGEAPEGWVVRIQPPTRNLEQNAKFHAICEDMAKAGMAWAGKPRSAAEWKVLLISGHAVATKEGSEIVPGLEGEFVSIRESSALMSVKRASSLIEYAVAYMAMNEETCQDA